MLMKQMYAGDSMNMGHELHLIFVQLHFLLFGVSMAFLCLSLLILFGKLRESLHAWSCKLFTQRFSFQLVCATIVRINCGRNSLTPAFR